MISLVLEVDPQTVANRVSMRSGEGAFELNLAEQVCDCLHLFLILTIIRFRLFLKLLPQQGRL